MLLQVPTATRERLKMASKPFIFLTNKGGLRVSKVAIRPSAIIAIMKPVEKTFGCIVEVDGDKFPVEEEFDNVVKMVEDFE